jgi:hypothetical protein
VGFAVTISMNVWSNRQQYLNTIKTQDRQHEVTLSDAQKEREHALITRLNDLESDSLSRSYSDFEKQALQLRREFKDDEFLKTLGAESMMSGPDADFGALLELVNLNVNYYLMTCVDPASNSPSLNDARQHFCHGTAELFLTQDFCILKKRLTSRRDSRQ